MRLRCPLKTFALVFCLAALRAGAQYRQSSPEGAGSYCRLGFGPSFFQAGRLTSFGGPANSKAEYDVGFAADAAFGYAFNKFIAADFEFAGVGAQIKSVQGFYLNDTYLDNVPFLANVTLTFPIRRTRLVPYLGGGVGGSLTVFSTDGFGDGNVTVFGDDSEVVFAWQAYAGLRYKLNDHMLVGIGYKYFATADSSFSYSPYYPGSGPNLSLGFSGVQTHSIMLSCVATF